jgi:hypothetical protein
LLEPGVQVALDPGEVVSLNTQGLPRGIRGSETLFSLLGWDAIFTRGVTVCT